VAGAGDDQADSAAEAVAVQVGVDRAGAVVADDADDPAGFAGAGDDLVDVRGGVGRRDRGDKALNADGELLRLHDAYRAAEVPADPATVAEDFTFRIADTADAPPTAEGPPTPAILLIVWTDGAITPVPMNRET
jgi:hypothetical protein